MGFIAIMASLLPIIDDILPMILPSSVSVTRKSDIIPPIPPVIPTTTADGERGSHRVRVYSRDAVVNKLDKVCSTVLILSPNSYSTVRHHGEQDAIIYVASGSGVLLTAPKDEGSEPKRHELGQGDFAAVPAWTEYQALNESSAEQDTHWVIIRSGSHPVEVHLKGWGRGKAEYPPSRA